MNILSINTSLPIEIEYKGKMIKTGIFKKPVTGPVYVSKNNLVGDQQVDLENHGGEHKAVYAFSSDHYPHWSKVLQNPEMKPGFFGENLTISGFDESSLYVGDQLSIGQCILEITQPRVPCYKLGIAVGNKNMPRLFVANFATGAYLRVIEEGYIEAGDAVEVVKQGKFQLSIKSLFRSYFDKKYDESRYIMEKALLIPELSPEWKEKLSARLSMLNELQS